MRLTKENRVSLSLIITKKKLSGFQKMILGRICMKAVLMTP